MNEYDEQIHPLYDAMILLNPFISNNNANIEKGIQFIEDKMIKCGWKKENAKTSPNKTINFLCSHFDTSMISTRNPIHKILDLDILTPDLEKNKSLGAALFQFWKERLDSGIDPILAQVALGMLNAFCTSCSAERLFSKAGRVLTRDRMKLMSDVAEAQIIIMSNKELADKYCNFD